ncbi:hypothetical protein OIU76_024265, partial [Salix suchowensis]
MPLIVVIYLSKQALDIYEQGTCRNEQAFVDSNKASLILAHLMHHS